MEDAATAKSRSARGWKRDPAFASAMREIAALHFTKWRELNHTNAGLWSHEFTGINFGKCTKDVLLEVVKGGIMRLSGLQLGKCFSQGADEQRVVTLSSHDGHSAGILRDVRYGTFCSLYVFLRGWL